MKGKYLLLVLVSVFMLSGCITWGKGLDPRALHGRILIDPVMGKMYVIEYPNDGHKYWIHEMLPDGKGLIYHK